MNTTKRTRINQTTARQRDAIVLRMKAEPVPAVLDELARAGIPTTTQTLYGLRSKLNAKRARVSKAPAPAGARPNPSPNRSIAAPLNAPIALCIDRAKRDLAGLIAELVRERASSVLGELFPPSRSAARHSATSSASSSGRRPAIAE